MKKIVSVLLVLSLFMAGCSTLQTASDVLDILAPDPTPICDQDSTGVQVGGMQCIKFSDGTYSWKAE